MSPSRCPERARAFTLVEVMVAMVVVAIMVGALAIPFAAQVQMRRQEETRRILDEARDALLGFAAAHARLPCPSTARGQGLESFATGGDAANGQCADFHGGFLPGATLGLAGLDAEGFVRDAWPGPGNRIRYAVYGDGAAINGVANPLTRANGMQAATLAGLGAAPHYLFICGSGAGVNGSGCGPAANQLTRRAAVVMLSLGANASAAPPAGSDELRNVDGDAVFVSHEASQAPGSEFDDLLLWIPIHAVINRLLVAGRLP
jgi:prepilin-type N-terminal cleavage/methylation domain-containing protein